SFFIFVLIFTQPSLISCPLSSFPTRRSSDLTHELVVRWLSALPLGRRPRLVTTTGEFHTIRRQLQRLGEEGIAVVTVPALPAEGDRKSTRLNSSHGSISYAVFCLKKKIRNFA